MRNTNLTTLSPWICWTDENGYRFAVTRLDYNDAIRMQRDSVPVRITPPGYSHFRSYVTTRVVTERGRSSN